MSARDYIVLKGRGYKHQIRCQVDFIIRLSAWDFDHAAFCSNTFSTSYFAAFLDPGDFLRFGNVKSQHFTFFSQVRDVHMWFSFLMTISYLYLWALWDCKSYLDCREVLKLCDGFFINRKRPGSKTSPISHWLRPLRSWEHSLGNSFLSFALTSSKWAAWMSWCGFYSDPQCASWDLRGRGVCSDSSLCLRVDSQSNRSDCFSKWEIWV